MEEECARQIRNLRNRLIILSMIKERGEQYVIGVICGNYSNWTTQDHIECVGTGFDN